MKTENTPNEFEDAEIKELVNQSIDFVDARTPLSELTKNYLAFILIDFATKICSIELQEANKEIESLKECLWIELFNDLDKWSRSTKSSKDTPIKINELKQKYTLKRK